MRIQMRGVCKSFLNAAVLKDVDFDLESGEVHALMGENGAGKSTLMKTLMGVYAKDSGVILIDGRQVNFFHPKQVKGIDDLVNKGIHVLIVNPVDSAAVAPAVRDVIDRGIKVITVDRYVDEAEIDIDTYIGTDKVIAANKAGKYFALIAGQDAVIAVLEGIPSTSSNLDRMEG
ncbi:MAG: substrate-binding domain-containing protein, partial [Spirochaetaceae bacterium]|nr:substrate-binding domain-containing protein [Spirochaetaceae bacterium]